MAFEGGRDRFLDLAHRHFVGMVRGHGHSHAGAQVPIGPRGAQTPTNVGVLNEFAS